MDIELNKRIRSMRKQKGFSQSGMAKKLEISQMAYSKIERGKTKLNLEYINQLAEILEVNIWDLMNTQKEYSEVTKKELDFTKNLDLLVAFISKYDKKIHYLKNEIAILKHSLQPPSTKSR